MIDPIRESVLEMYDRFPADVYTYRQVVREIIGQLDNYTPTERMILAWDRNGRPEIEREPIRQRAWNFAETGVSALRKRLFAGFVTNSDETDGYGAEFLLDTAECLGIPPDVTYEIMIRNLKLKG